MVFNVTLGAALEGLNDLGQGRKEFAPPVVCPFSLRVQTIRSGTHFFGFFREREREMPFAEQLLERRLLMRA